MIVFSEKHRRPGAATVEMAMVTPLLVAVLFGIFEYGRFVFVYQTATNAARDGARFASARTGGVATTDDVIKVVNDRLGGVQNQLVGYKVDVFYADPAGLIKDPPEVIPHSAGKSWDATPFGDKIGVRITGTYMPTMVWIVNAQSSVPMDVTILTASEGN
jgi:Flp pilus assembly protein TadG